MYDRFYNIVFPPAFHTACHKYLILLTKLFANFEILKYIQSY